MIRLQFISEKNRERYLKIISPIGNILGKIGIHPNILTICGLILSLIACLFYANGSFFWAAWIVVLAGTCDTLDGQLARTFNKKSAFGAFFDSTLDRYSDMLLYLGIAYHFAGGKEIFFKESSAQSIDASPWMVFIIILTIAGSFMVSYTRARAEAIGVKCNIGLMQRAERIVLLIIGSLLASIPGIGIYIIKLTLVVLAITTNITAIHRMLHVKSQLMKAAGS